MIENVLFFLVESIEIRVNFSENRAITDLGGPLKVKKEFFTEIRIFFVVWFICLNLLLSKMSCVLNSIYRSSMSKHANVTSCSILIKTLLYILCQSHTVKLSKQVCGL